MAISRNIAVSIKWASFFVGVLALRVGHCRNPDFWKPHNVGNSVERPLH